MSNQTQQAPKSNLEAPRKEPAIFLLAELSWGDDAYGENLPVAGLVRVTENTLQKVGQVANLIQDGVISNQGAFVQLPAADVAWLSKVCFTGENSLAAVPGFFVPEADRLLYMGDAADMEIDGTRADFGDECQRFEFSDPREQEFSSLRLQVTDFLEMGVSVAGMANGFAMGGYFESWPLLREQIATGLDQGSREVVTEKQPT